LILLIALSIDGDLNNFDKRLKQTNKPYDNSSSDEESGAKPQVVDRKNPIWVLEEKNRVLLDRLYKSEKQLDDLKQTADVLKSDNDSLKDKKIVELSKKNRALQIQAESLKTKAAKAAEFAIDLKKENDARMNKTASSNLPENQLDSPMKSMGGGGTLADDKKSKELEKRITKLRNENQE